MLQEYVGAVNFLLIPPAPTGLLPHCPTCVFQAPAAIFMGLDLPIQATVLMTRKVDASRKLQKRAELMIPGGVNSPVRAFGSVGGDPPFLVRGQGSHLWDADENRYI